MSLQLLPRSCRAINAFRKNVPFMIGLSKEETDQERKRINPVQQSTAPPALEQGQADRCKAATTASHVWSIRTKLQLEKRTRDLALFNLAIDSKLRGCDVVAIRVDERANRRHLDQQCVTQTSPILARLSSTP
jgi:hypothetical protein